MKSNWKTFSAFSLVVAVSSSLAACAGAEGYGDEDTLGAESGDEIGEAEFALNGEDNCGEADPNRSYDSIITPTFTSPSNYANGRNGCGLAYFVEVDDYRENNSNKHNYFEYGGAQPGSQAACEALQMRVYVFEKLSNGDVAFVGSKVNRGEPMMYFDGTNVNYVTCSLPRVRIEEQCSNRPNNFNLTTGKDYMFAVSARSGSSQSPVMQPIKMGSGSRAYCPGPG